MDTDNIKDDKLELLDACGGCQSGQSAANSMRRGEVVLPRDLDTIKKDAICVKMHSTTRCFRR